MQPVRECGTAARNPRQAGVTLLEILIGVTIIILGLIPLAGVLLASHKQYDDSASTYRLHLAAANQLEQILIESNSVSGFMTLYTDGEGTFNVNDGLYADLPVSNLAGRITITPTDLGVERTALFQINIDYTDGRNNDRTQAVRTLARLEDL